MRNKIALTFYIFLFFFIISQTLKYGFVHNDWNVQGPIMSLQLAYNKGVAFSMFAFLAEYLKYIQLSIVTIGLVYLYKNKELFDTYYISIGLLLAGALSNILDRFTYGAVVDFFYWHYGFEFAIFNFADVLINIAVAIIIYIQIKEYREEKKLSKKEE